MLEVGCEIKIITIAAERAIIAAERASLSKRAQQQTNCSVGSQKVDF